MWESALGYERDEIGRLIHGFQSALVTQDVRMADQARKELAAALDQLEGPGWL